MFAGNDLVMKCWLTACAALLTIPRLADSLQAESFQRVLARADTGGREIGRNDQDGPHRPGVPKAAGLLPNYPDVVYKTLSGKPLKLDVYLPSNATNSTELLPAVLYIHPGGWAMGGRKAISRYALQLLKEGIIVVSLDYRLTSQKEVFKNTSVVWPAQGRDVVDAVEFIRRRGHTWGISEHRLGCWGESAGGHLCAWLATAGTLKLGSPLNVAVDMCGPTCFLCPGSKPGSLLGPLPADWLFGFGHGELQLLKNHEVAEGIPTGYANLRRIKSFGFEQPEKELVLSAEPLAHVTARSSPIFIAHGDNDPLVPVAKAQWLSAKLAHFGVDHEYMEVRGGKHLYDMWPDEAAHRAVAFVANHLVTRKASITASPKPDVGVSPTPNTTEPNSTLQDLAADLTATEVLRTDLNTTDEDDTSQEDVAQVFALEHMTVDMEDLV